MGFTTNYALPYPELSDSANVPRDQKALAEAVDAKLGSGQPFCEATATAAQSMPTSQETTIVYQTSLASHAGMFTNGGSAITVPVAGLYQVIAVFSWVANPTGSRIAVLKQSGASIRSWAIGGAGVNANLSGTLSVFRSVAAGATFSLALYQASGAALSTHNQSYPLLAVARLGPNL